MDLNADTSTFKKIVSESKAYRKQKERDYEEEKKRKEELKNKETSEKITKEKRERQLKVGKILLEFNTSKNVVAPRAEYEDEIQKGRPGRRPKENEEKNKKLYLSLSPKDIARFRKVKPSGKFKHYKQFGDSRRLVSLLNEVDRLNERERIRVEKFRSKLRKFGEAIEQYEKYFRRGENASYAEHFLAKLKDHWTTIIIVYSALSFTRDEITPYLTKDENKWLSYVNLFKDKIRSGEFSF